MIFSINPVNNLMSSNKVYTSAQFSLYKDAQVSAQKVSKIVFQSIAMLTNSSDSGISMEDLQNVKQLIESKDLTKSSAYALVNTMIEKFNALSSDGQAITENDFLNTIKFAVAQDYRENTDLYSALRPKGIDFSKDLLSMFGQVNLETLDLMTLMESLSDETINKIIQNLKDKEASGENTASTDKTMKSNGPTLTKSSAVTNPSAPQDYKTVTSAQLKTPINIAV